MSYSEVGIANLALGRIGAKRIASFTENTPNAIKVREAWDYILDELLAKKDWRFAKTRVQLATITTEPVYAYTYAYQLPSDFLRLAEKTKTIIPSTNPADYYNGLITQDDDEDGLSSFITFDSPVWPPGYSYKIEEVEVSTTNHPLCLLSDYYNEDLPLKITYIRRETNPARFSPLFISAFVSRLASEFAISIAESVEKQRIQYSIYKEALREADIHNRSLDYNGEDETGSNAWESTGRT